MIIRGLCQNFIIRRGKIYKPRTGLKLNKKSRMDIRKQSGKSRGRYPIKGIERHTPVQEDTFFQAQYPIKGIERNL